MPPAKHQELQGTGSAQSAASCFACALPGFSADWSPFRGGRGWPWLAGDAPILLLTHPPQGDRGESHKGKCEKTLTVKIQTV